MDCAICSGAMSLGCDLCLGRSDIYQIQSSHICKHKFHKCCIERWFARVPRVSMASRCPLCTLPWASVKVRSLMELCTIKLRGDERVEELLSTIDIDEKFLELWKKISV